MQRPEAHSLRPHPAVGDASGRLLPPIEGAAETLRSRCSFGNPHFGHFAFSSALRINNSTFALQPWQ